ncbi:hypothetical protein [Ponticaulis sp.]|uniref:hypothetical protein n=1 Tax=Ponticaulis sp. TaxID=2020902 RepID=UPI000B6EE375|nr:hypothetical protein [Ponticaulis sp.]MAI89338.1 hypothetical protein [Ponticaulis sp.]OUY00926.1 MAG: hypothetical protein CBB65_02735 [Hyphomonadaceae bacterium TMED5]|tara:strand:- start:11145 stop:11447 length:303 start_codon:yes stop_codon:yes gene_type:complete
MKTGLALAAVIAFSAPVALAQEAGNVTAEFKFENNLTTEANYEAIEARANTACRSATRRSDTFAPTDTREVVEACRTDLVDAAVAALGIQELTDMHDARS